MAGALGETGEGQGRPGMARGGWGRLGEVGGSGGDWERLEDTLGDTGGIRGRREKPGVPGCARSG